MNQRRFGAALTLMATSALAACTTMVEFTSTPSGAVVRYQDQAIGATPFAYVVTDQFGWWSTYTFVATRDGFESQSLVFHERTPLDAQMVVPPKVQFDLKPKSAAAAAERPK
jgi:hypothetical protein